MGKKKKYVKKKQASKKAKTPENIERHKDKEDIIREKIKRALVELHEEGFYIVTISAIRARAGVREEEIDDNHLAQMVSEAKEELGISRPSIGGKTI